MKKIFLAFTVLIGAAFTSQIVMAETALTQHFNEKDSCYARQYSADHLKKNPNQIVSFLQFGHFPSVNNGWASPPEEGEVRFSVIAKFKGNDKEYSNSGRCLSENGTLNCQIECDGGGFVLKHKDADSILLYTRPGQGFVVSGCDAGDIRLITDQTDDKIFLLHRTADAQCTYPY